MKIRARPSHIEAGRAVVENPHRRTGLNQTLLPVGAAHDRPPPALGAHHRPDHIAEAHFRPTMQPQETPEDIHSPAEAHHRPTTQSQVHQSNEAHQRPANSPFTTTV